MTKQKEKELEKENTILSTLVDKSKVSAVNKANSERDKAIQDKDDAIAKAKKEIDKTNADANMKIHEANFEKDKAINDKDMAIENFKRTTALYIGMLGIVLFIIALRSGWFISDLIDCIKVPFITIKGALLTYISWMTSSFDMWWEVALRIVSAIGIISLIVVIIGGIWYLISTYRDEYDNRHLIIAVISFAILCVFGDMIKTVIDINLIPIYLVIQIIGMFCCQYFDKNKNCY